MSEKTQALLDEYQDIFGLLPTIIHIPDDELEASLSLAIQTGKSIKDTVPDTDTVI